MAMEEEEGGDALLLKRVTPGGLGSGGPMWHVLLGGPHQWARKWGHLHVAAGRGSRGGGQVRAGGEVVSVRYGEHPLT